MGFRFTCVWLVVALVCLVHSLGYAESWTWAKGNLHTHTSNSDGDAPPEAVVDWYRSHDYGFLVISDHSKLTPTADLDADLGDRFVLVPGEELNVRDAKVQLHANALGIASVIAQPDASATPARSLAKLVGSIRDAGGIPMVNHPNFGWSFGHRELLDVKDPYLLEVFNGHPAVNNAGNAAFLPVEQTWDILLSEGKTVYATATDDAHNFKEMKPNAANPGRGWVYVRVTELTPKAILAGLAKGDFYPSTGVELSDYSFDGKEFRVGVKPKEGQTFLVRFVGKHGRILQETPGVSATYRVTEKGEANSYIRCKVICSDHTVAWTQAYRL